MNTKSQSKDGDPVPWNDIPENCISHEEIEQFVSDEMEDMEFTRAECLALLAIDYGLDPEAYEIWNDRKQAVRARMRDALKSGVAYKRPAAERAEEMWGK